MMAIIYNTTTEAPSQMRSIRFAAELIGVKIEKPAECPWYLRDHVLEGVRS
jgi:hypothetical protein